MTQHWHCTTCNKLLGRIEDGRLVIEHGRVVVRTLPGGTERLCQCGTWNTSPQPPATADETAA